MHSILKIVNLRRLQLYYQYFCYRFLKKSLIELQQNYNEFMPLYPIIDFIQDYGKILNHQQIEWNDSKATILSQYSIEFERIAKAAKENVYENNEQIEDKISVH